MEMNEVRTSWKQLISRHINEKNFTSCTCKIYNNRSLFPSNDPDKLCPCGRLVRRHSFNGESLQEKAAKSNGKTTFPPDKYGILAHGAKVPVDTYGQLKSNGCKFLRIDIRSQMKVIYDLLVADCEGENPKPHLVLSVYGGAKYFTMTERLEKEIIRGIVDAAIAADAWILTAGISNGVSKLVGEGISHHRLLREDSNKVKCIGLTMWGTINEDTRIKLRVTSSRNKSALNQLVHRQIPDNFQEDKETIEPNHTYCILFDDGQLNEYLGDPQRNALVDVACQQEDHTCYAVTIIVEGGVNTLEVIQNDLDKQRPIVLIQDSGRIADVLATLINQSLNAERNYQQIQIDEEIKKAIQQFLPDLNSQDMSTKIAQIRKILDKKNRHLLNVFSLDRDSNVAETIFKAIFTVKNKKNEIDNSTDTHDQKRKRQIDEDKLVNLALKWNYFEGALPILQVRQNLRIKKKRELIKEELEREKQLFVECLEKNRPKFIEYFLAAGSDPCTLVDIKDTTQRYKFLSDLYHKSRSHMNKTHENRITTLFGKQSDTTMDSLDNKLNKFIGAYVKSIYAYKNDSYKRRICIDMRNHVCTCCKFQTTSDDILFNHNNKISSNTSEYSKDELLRDLFLWSVFMDMSEMAKIFLVHLPSRICAALIASAIFKRYAKASIILDHKEKFEDHALEFETYAAMFIDKCYEYNERVACELLLRQIPLFGNITCMQVAISSESVKLVRTPCFDQALSQVWYNKLSITNQQTYAKPLQFLSLLSGGLLAPVLIPYREEEENRTKDEQLSSDGINYYNDGDSVKTTSWKMYWLRLKYFHGSPLTKMCYDFISYIWFLLVFSYMMLYHLDSPDTFTIPHWTEIYVIITVSTMLCEEVRRLSHDYRTRMIEGWGSTGSTLLTVFTNMFFIIPYLLFYLGLGFRYQGYTESILTTARIIWAFDLELWYLGSLRFIIVLKSVGPKLFMLKNMLQDLTAFVYMIFIAIAAYGVVSRALILYNEVPFTGSDIFKQIFYEPYWFIYGEFSDKELLDDKIDNATESVVAGATATHVLLAFHMLFINILILNLLIAVFTHTIDKVQENTEFHWRYQRYSFIREYFERPPFGYPPLIIIPHIILIFLTLRRICCQGEAANTKYATKSKNVTPVFKMIPKNPKQRNSRWDAFESAATHSSARSILEANKKKGISITDDNYSKKTTDLIDSDMIKSINDQQQTIASLKEEIMTLKSSLTNTQKNTEGDSLIEIRSNQEKMNESLQWIMKAITRVKMNDPNEPRPTLDTRLTTRDRSYETQAPTSPTQ